MDKSVVYDELKRNPKNARFNRYAIEIFYTEEDEGYIAIVPELPECSAFGENEEEALKEIKVAIDLWLETAKKDGREIPKLTGKELLRTTQKATQLINTFINYPYLY
ncbi:MAG: type II toxin-antitoxin system HicB family antitoxin [Candidatus Methanoperedens sp.]|nr:type II toxin-antitoxin system HicB family antitoxin [Candidatus Methanoperedens sp.]